MAQRIKGQDVKLAVFVNNVPASYISDIRNFEATPKIEKLEEQYLGQFSKRYDEIFHGIDFKFDIHVEDSNVLTFIDTIKRRASGKAPNTQFNITATLNFPVGGPKVITLIDCFFEDLPFSFGGRSEYGQVTISGSCESYSA